MAHTSTKIDRDLPFNMLRVNAITKNPNLDVGNLWSNRIVHTVYDVSLLTEIEGVGDIYYDHYTFYAREENDKLIIFDEAEVVLGYIPLNDPVGTIGRRTILAMSIDELLYREEASASKEDIAPYFINDESFHYYDYFDGLDIQDLVFIIEREGLDPADANIMIDVSSTSRTITRNLGTINKWATFKPIDRGTSSALTISEIIGTGSKNEWDGIKIDPFNYDYVYTPPTVSSTCYARLHDFAGYDYSAEPGVWCESLEAMNMFDLAEINIKIPNATNTFSPSCPTFPFGYIVNQYHGSSITKLNNFNIALLIKGKASGSSIYSYYLNPVKQMLYTPYGSDLYYLDNDTIRLTNTALPSGQNIYDATSCLCFVKKPVSAFTMCLLQDFATYKPFLIPNSTKYWGKLLDLQIIGPGSHQTTFQMVFNNISGSSMNMFIDLWNRNSITPSESDYVQEMYNSTTNTWTIPLDKFYEHDASIGMWSVQYDWNKAVVTVYHGDTLFETTQLVRKDRGLYATETYEGAPPGSYSAMFSFAETLGIYLTSTASTTMTKFVIDFD